MSLAEEQRKVDEEVIAQILFDCDLRDQHMPTVLVRDARDPEHYRFRAREILNYVYNYMMNK